MRIYGNVLLTFVIVGLFGWAMSSYYQASVEITRFVADSSREYVFQINLTPVVIILLLVVLFVYITKQKKKNKLWTKALLLPGEFSEDDEREKQITSQACRSAYVNMWYSFPIITAFLLFYPFIEEKIPSYPVLVFLLLPLVQVISYILKWKKLY